MVLRTDTYLIKTTKPRGVHIQCNYMNVSPQKIFILFYCARVKSCSSTFISCPVSMKYNNIIVTVIVLKQGYGS